MKTKRRNKIWNYLTVCHVESGKRGRFGRLPLFHGYVSLCIFALLFLTPIMILIEPVTDPQALPPNTSPNTSPGIGSDGSWISQTGTGTPIPHLEPQSIFLGILSQKLQKIEKKLDRDGALIPSTPSPLIHHSLIMTRVICVLLIKSCVSWCYLRVTCDVTKRGSSYTCVKFPVN